ncbi:MAG: ATP-binding cassette domain-containing protein [Helicobacteraceae bacterium]|jgi:NitT/TauT family transport system ATP-binding protein|nr:ATP-binding cassette domain-containing protein [Helicobacteraceae bacterium]
MNAVLEARNLTLRYQNDLVFSNLSFTIKPREIVALIGKSGCGKSSLLSVAGALIKPSEGEMLFQGKPLNAPSPKIATVFQEPSLLPWLSVERNVSLALELKSMRAPKSERKKRTAEALSEVDLSGAAKKFPRELSGGMAQRAALARALARRAELALLDEPFSALDAITRKACQKLLKNLIRAHESSALIVTHDIDEALSLSDRTLLMRREANDYGALEEWDINARLTTNNVERDRRARFEYIDLREEISFRLEQN